MHLHLSFRWSFTHKHEVCGSVLRFARALRPPATSCSMVGRAQEIPNCYEQCSMQQIIALVLRFTVADYELSLTFSVLISASNVRLWWTLEVSELPCACVRDCVMDFIRSPSFDDFITECSKCSYSYNGIQLLPKRELLEDLFTNLITILSYTDIKWSYIALQQTKRFQHCDLIGNFKQTKVYTLLSF